MQYVRSSEATRITGNDDPEAEEEGQKEGVQFKQGPIEGDENNEEAEGPSMPNEPNAGLFQLQHPRC